TLGAEMAEITPKFYERILPSPFGDELTLAFARAAVEGEQLGADATTDILTLSLSSHDYINHAFGPESRLSQDHFLQLDRHLQRFFQYLDAKVGAANYLAVLTADHGFSDTPEWAASQGRDAGRVDPRQTMDRVNAGLSRKFGEARYARYFSAAGLLFDEKLIAARGLQPADVYAEAKAVLLQLRGIEAVFTPDQLQGTDTDTYATAPYLDAMRKSWHPARAAPLQIVLRRGWLMSSRATGSSHGTPYDYDNHVPILAWGPEWVGRGEVDQRVEVADIAPTLSLILGQRAPAQSQGRPLPLPLPMPARN
ncbi:MAG: alkaline phosphatase family protein, partial [Burkholderiaceae bacterium]